jgi:transcriptional regulator with XRE-family HTH domain
MEKVVQALKAWPGSLRALAREAGVSHVTLLRLRTGDRPSAETSARLARALEQAGRRCQQAAATLRRTR